MNGIGNEFHPSVIEDCIYDILCEPEYVVSTREYTKDAIDAVQAYLEECGNQFNIIEDSYPDMTGASVSICWIEKGYLHHIVLNIRY